MNTISSAAEKGERIQGNPYASSFIHTPSKLLPSVLPLFLLLNSHHNWNKKEMASSSITMSMSSFHLRVSPLRHSYPLKSSPGSVKLTPLNKLPNSLRLSSTHSISGSSSLLLPNNNFSFNLIPTFPDRSQSLTVFAAKGYKMKTHKVNISLVWFAVN